MTTRTRAAGRWSAAALAALLALAPVTGRASVNTRMSGNTGVTLDGGLAVQLKGLEAVVAQLDGDLQRLLATAQSQARDDAIALLQETRAALTAQIEQLRQGAIEAINAVADRVDEQLRTALRAAQQLHAQLQVGITRLEQAVAAHVAADIAQAEQSILRVLRQAHAELTRALRAIGAYVEEGIDRFYVRTEHAAQQAAVESRAFVDSAALVAARAVLAAVFLLLLLRVVRQAVQVAGRSERGALAEPIAGAAVLVVLLVSMVSTPLLQGALGIRPPAPVPDACTLAAADYTRFVADTEGIAAGSPDRRSPREVSSGEARPVAARPRMNPEYLRYEAVMLQEELQRCAYLSVSKDRREASAGLMQSVRVVLDALPAGSISALAER